MPRAEEDASPRSQGPGGQPKGAEAEQQAFKQAALKPVQTPFNFEAAALPPEEPEEPINPELMAPPGMEIPGLGNLGEILFGATQRPWENVNTAPRGEMIETPGPTGPPREYLNLLHDPAVSAGTKSMIGLLARINMLRAEPGSPGSPPPAAARRD